MARNSICLATSSVESVRLKPAGGFHARSPPAVESWAAAIPEPEAED